MPTRPNKGQCVLITTCVEARGEDIAALDDTAVEITRRTFMSYLSPGQWESLHEKLGYDVTGRKGLSLAKDWHVSYGRGVYRGAPCVYIMWSSIHHVFAQSAS